MEARESLHVNKKQFILEKSRRLFYNVGIRLVSMDDIAKECGISKKTICFYFENKSEVVRMVLQLYLEEFEDSLNNIISSACNPVDELKSLIKSLFSVQGRMSALAIKDLKEYYAGIYGNAVHQNKSALSKFLKRNIASGVKKGWYLPIEYIDKFIKTFIEFIAFIFLEKEPYFIKEDEALQFGTLMINVLADEKGKAYLL
ncbi:transcriptional regulator BetI [Sphingobacterium multivorum]|uniref:TetR/AcrR family transcriptional regulator n=1 Tax=Sphingobacterium multivorum TaxID=28454 RepID=UPI000E076F15|nr:TetR/AcrR family transcriptional regulator [Sphingobacterium multivorum]QQT46633.1 TetR/AcrR family transcriptional regulator [Sphingobacterium multivorum]SUJ89353.1 transcriptional regulator BetI [Sphingobacterium multivorum]